MFLSKQRRVAAGLSRNRDAPFQSPGLRGHGRPVRGERARLRPLAPLPGRAVQGLGGEGGGRQSGGDLEQHLALLQKFISSERTSLR